jgi:hypothetical protein
MNEFEVCKFINCNIYVGIHVTFKNTYDGGCAIILTQDDYNYNYI